MRIRIAYETRYAYAHAARGLVQHLRMTPRDHDGQRIARWRVEVDAPGRMRKGEDGFGNVLHAFSSSTPFEHMVVRVTGEVDTRDTSGVVAGAVERFPPAVFLRPTALTAGDATLEAFADAALAGAGLDTLDRLHALMRAVHEAMAFETGATSTVTTATQALALGRGVCQDLAHVFIACARRAGVPARYVSGHLFRPDTPEQEAAHAWAEAWVEDLGWTGFDPTNGVCPAERHLRVAVAPDYLGAAPVRGARYGGGGETMEVRLRVEDAGFAAQSGRRG